MDLEAWPLVGREDELELAVAALARHGGVVLTGAAGVGKTRLAHEVLARSARDGDRTTWIAATEAAARVPLGAVAHLVPSEAIGRGRDATLRAIAATVERATGDHRLLLGVDDGHLLDDASAALIHLLVTTGAASPVVTVRSGAPVPDPILAIWKDGPAPLLVLQALARGEMEELLTSVLGGPIEGASLHLLWELSGGNALFLRELVRHGVESGALRLDGGLWRWPERFAPGERLRDLVALRMGALGDEERSALEVLAIGEPLTVRCLQELGIVQVVERLERRGLLGSRRSDTTEITMAHPLFGEVVRDGMPATRLDEVRLLLADATEMTSRAPADAFRAALWRVDAGDRSRPEQLCAAARRAWALWSAPVAERLARAALESGPELEAGYLLGEALSDQARPEEALQAWRAVEDLPGPDRVRAALVMGQASTLNYQLARPAEAVAVLQRAAAGVEDPRARQRIDAALRLFGATTPGSTSEDPELDAGAAPTAVLAATLEKTAAGQLDAAIRLSDEAMAGAAVWSEEFPSVVLFLRLARAWARLLSGQVLEVGAEADVQYAAAVMERTDYPRVSWCLVRGVAALLRGRPESAAGAVREGVAVARSDDRGWHRPMQTYLAMAAALRGDVAGADDHLRRAEVANGSLDGIFAVDVRRAGAWVRAASGELTAAVAEARGAAAHAAEAGQSGFEVSALHDVARFGRPAEVADRLDELRELVDGEMVGAMAAHARALVAADGPGLDDASDAFASLGLDLFAAEASAAAAAAYRAAGRRASAAAARVRSRALAARCEDAQTPALAWADDADDLTGREREVAELAAAGLSSRAIAERLGITTRTVDNLLGRVYVKLGVSGRRELVEVLGARRLRE